ncbi:hypothetical protein SNEBB_005195 [Seison nebaliae]|nr:hypothetical protein SNEBB_005195 [Seison nebaliae]
MGDEWQYTGLADKTYWDEVYTEQFIGSNNDELNHWFESDVVDELKNCVGGIIEECSNDLTIIDIGCGEGQFCSLIHEMNKRMNKTIEIIGIDYCQKAIDKARINCNSNIQLNVVDVTSDESIDSFIDSHRYTNLLLIDMGTFDAISSKKELIKHYVTFIKRITNSYFKYQFIIASLNWTANELSKIFAETDRFHFLTKLKNTNKFTFGGVSGSTSTLLHYYIRIDTPIYLIKSSLNGNDEYLSLLKNFHFVNSGSIETIEFRYLVHEIEERFLKMEEMNGFIFTSKRSVDCLKSAKNVNLKNKFCFVVSSITGEYVLDQLKEIDRDLVFGFDCSCRDDLIKKINSTLRGKNYKLLYPSSQLANDEFRTQLNPNIEVEKFTAYETIPNPNLINEIKKINNWNRSIMVFFSSSNIDTFMSQFKLLYENFEEFQWKVIIFGESSKKTLMNYFKKSLSLTILNANPKCLLNHLMWK